MATLKDLVERRYKERDIHIKESVINGVQTFDEYRYHIGYLRGMWDLMQDIAPLLKDPESAGDGEE